MSLVTYLKHSISQSDESRRRVRVLLSNPYLAELTIPQLETRLPVYDMRTLRGSAVCLDQAQIDDCFVVVDNTDDLCALLRAGIVHCIVVAQYFIDHCELRVLSSMRVQNQLVRCVPNEAGDYTTHVDRLSFNRDIPELEKACTSGLSAALSANPGADSVLLAAEVVKNRIAASGRDYAVAFHVSPRGEVGCVPLFVLSANLVSKDDCITFNHYRNE